MAGLDPVVLHWLEKRLEDAERDVASDEEKMKHLVAETRGLERRLEEHQSMVRGIRTLLALAPRA